MARECKMRKIKICLTQLPLLTGGNTVVLRRVMEQGKLSARHCCSPSLQELAGDVLSEPEALFLF